MIILQRGDFGMGRWLFTLAFAGLAGCAQTSMPQPSASERMMENYKQDMELEKAHKAEHEKLLRGATADLDNALARFAKEKPQKCNSKSLEEARVAAAASVLALNEKSTYAWGLSGIATIVGASLDYADAARKAGCAKKAEEIYELVIGKMIGSDYAALRQRAEIGLRALQTARR